jgi:hydroxymethylbilane synthase
MVIGTLTLGTRGSALALAQVGLVENALRAAHPPLAVEHVIVQTTGDLRPDLRLGHGVPGLDKSVWVKELEMELEAGRIDAAVHSAKDVPTELPPGCHLVACLPRAAANDVLLSKHAGGLEGLPRGARVATSSVRRQRQLMWKRPDVEVVEIRGNVPTRLRKLGADAELDALLLAKAGLDRLRASLDPFQITVLDPAVFLPAAGQGVIVMEVWGDDAARDEVLAAVNDQTTWTALRAEREVLKRLGAGCSTPVAVHSHIDGNDLHLRVLVFDETAATAPPREATTHGPAANPDRVAADVVRRL